MSMHDFSDSEVPPPPPFSGTPFGGTPPKRRRGNGRTKFAATPAFQAVRDAISNMGPSTSCLMCDCKTYPKSKFCKEHKREAEACRKDAEESNELEYFNSQAANVDAFRKMTLEYMEKGPSRGPGAKRNRFDWTSYKGKKHFPGRQSAKDKKQCLCITRPGRLSQLFRVVLQIIFAHYIKFHARGSFIIAYSVSLNSEPGAGTLGPEPRRSS